MNKRIRFTRAQSVRQYTDYEIDTDDLTPAQLAAVEQIGEWYGEITDPEVIEALSDLCEDLTDIGEDIEDNLEDDERGTDFMLQGNRP